MQGTASKVWPSLELQCRPHTHSLSKYRAIGVIAANFCSLILRRLLQIVLPVQAEHQEVLWTAQKLFDGARFIPESLPFWIISAHPHASSTDDVLLLTAT